MNINTYESHVIQVISGVKAIIDKRKLTFLHKIHDAKLFEDIVKRTKIHVQIMRFMCCLNIGFNLKIL